MNEARLLIQPIKGVTVVNFQDPNILDTLQIQKIATALYDLVDKEAHRRLLLDFSGVMFISSQAIGVLLTLNKKMKAIKGEVALCGIKPDLMKVFKITRIDKLFNFYETEKAALEGWQITTA